MVLSLSGYVRVFLFFPGAQHSRSGCSPLSGSSFWTLAAWHKNLNTRVKCPLVLQLLKRVNTFSETSSLCTHTPHCHFSCQSPHSLVVLGRGLKLKMLPFHLTSVVLARHLYCLKAALLSWPLLHERYLKLFPIGDLHTGNRNRRHLCWAFLWYIQSHLLKSAWTFHIQYR